MYKKAAISLALAGLVAVGTWLVLRQGANFGPSLAGADGTLAYVASADQKVYAVDLRSGVVVRTSERIQEMGRPTAIAYRATDHMLFISSERGYGQNDYYPLVAVNAAGQFVVARKYTPGATGEEQLLTDVPNTTRSAVYSVVAAPDGRTLYLGLAQPNAAPTTLFDTVSGTSTGQTSVPIRRGNYISPDGTEVAEVWPSGRRTVDENGRSVVREWAGGVLVREIRTGRVVSRVDLTDNQGLRPPWSADLGPYLYVEPGTTELVAYDRVTGKKTSTLDMQTLTGMIPAQKDAIAVPNSSLAAVPMSSSDGRGFVAVVDLASARVSSSIEVGPSPTNIVLAEDKD